MKRKVYILILLIFSLISLSCWYFYTCSEAMKELSLAIFSSALFAMFIESGFLINDIFRFSFLKGRWIRAKFYNRNGETSGIGYEDLSVRYAPDIINPNIKLKYIEDGEYRGIAYYEGGEKRFILILNKNNILSGSGTYQYVKQKNNQETPDIGTFEFLIDINKNKIYIEHENKLPSGNAKGIEIWERLLKHK